MMLVIAYDVDTTNSAGAQRLRKVARLCERYGSRVQNSVFEVLLDPAQLSTLKAGLEKIICKESDSVRIYRLGDRYRSRIEVIGRTCRMETGEPLIL
ncbi:MAG TPA: CRISPR-associated endonuclease Cas2 [Clostridiales bacterium]|nr:CRISPR-associated endonuclease Cas2 [Clostridiales bacterium]